MLCRSEIKHAKKLSLLHQGMTTIIDQFIFAKLRLITKFYCNLIYVIKITCKELLFIINKIC